jgi:serine/threonine protein kinase
MDEATLAPTKPGVGRVVAIKKLRKESFQGHREWLAEVTYLGELHHGNLVSLVGYCSDSAGSNKLLVYEYMVRGSLENHLFRRGTLQPLSWPMRVSIAVDVARGMSFLFGRIRIGETTATTKYYQCMEMEEADMKSLCSE